MPNKADKKRKIDFSKYEKVLAFLCLEILAFVSFSLGNSFILYTILAFALFVLLLIVTFAKIKKEGVPDFAFLLFPLFLFGILSALSNFIQDSGYFLKGFSLIFLPLSMILFPGSGYLLGHNKEFKLSMAFLVIYIALGAYVAINMVATFVEFAPFHTITYANKYIYYDGNLISTPVGKMAYALIGFAFEEVSIAYYTLFPIMLLTSSGFLFFIKYKEQKKIFVTYSCLTALALIAIIFSITKLTLIMFLGVIALIAIIVLTSKKKIPLKVIKYGSITIGVIFVLVLLVLILNSQYVLGPKIGFIQNIISGNSLLNKIFTTNGYVQKINVVLDGLFSEFKLFGLFTGSIEGFTDTYAFTERYTIKEVYPTNSWLFDLILTSGTFGFFIFTIILVFLGRNLYKYCKNSGESTENKTIIVLFIVCLFAYCLLNYDMRPLVLKDTLLPFTNNNLFLISLMLFGYCSYYKNEEAVPVIEKKEETTIIEEVHEDEISL